MSTTEEEYWLPEEVLQVLPTDPFAQLDVARKITSIALSTRVTSLENEASLLRSQLDRKDAIIFDLQSRIDSLDTSLGEVNQRLSLALQEKESLVKENSSLSNTVAKLRKDVSKLEVFRKTLMQSLQEEGSTAGGQNDATNEDTTHESISVQAQSGDDGVTPPPSAYSSTEIESLERGNSLLEDRDPDAARPRISAGLLLASQTTTPRLTPPGSPPIRSASGTPSKTSKPASPRRHSISFSTTRGMVDTLPSSTHSSFSSTDGGSQSGRTRVDGKEFFRQVRSRLSYEQFGAFLANVKELNSHKQTKEDTLRKADEIFGPDNKDLYTIFEGLLTRNLH